MSKMTNYLEEQLIMHEFRTGTYAKPTAQYIGLIRANKGKWATGIVYSVNDYVVPVASNGRLYKCTTGGTSGASEPTWGTTEGGTTADGTAVWTEQTLAIEAGTPPEVGSGIGYARINLAPADANWSAPAGGNGATDNLAAIQFGTPTGDWDWIVGFFTADAVSAGNIKLYGIMATPKRVVAGADAPKFDIGTLDIVYG
ncbi:MAG TPA: hypothetical protein VJ396_01105 [Acidiferrobacterales bacterium]|nr:hypothetical protein [Acidiferrobacterales bacterium]